MPSNARWTKWAHDLELFRTSDFKADPNGASGTSDMHGNAARVAGMSREANE